eukprot:c6808_g1_i1.p1 GENE.c6808_g1_i1~~c6808_g1_i1.p1  ORF type:complete len:254 (-),score=67.57 c6808_g1_i1:697-1458(-)
MAEVMRAAPSIQPERTFDDSDISADHCGVEENLATFLFVRRSQIDSIANVEVTDDSMFADDDDTVPNVPPTPNVTTSSDNMERNLSQDLQSCAQAPHKPQITNTTKITPQETTSTGSSSVETLKKSSTSSWFCSPGIEISRESTNLLHSRTHQIVTMVQNVFEVVVGERVYDPMRVQQWTSELAKLAVHQLVTCGWPFKFVVQAILLCSKHGDLHMLSSCLWNRHVDGGIHVVQKNKADVECVIIVFGVHTCE